MVLASCINHRDFFNQTLPFLDTLGQRPHNVAIFWDALKEHKQGNGHVRKMKTLYTNYIHSFDSSLFLFHEGCLADLTLLDAKVILNSTRLVFVPGGNTNILLEAWRTSKALSTLEDQ